MGHHHRYSCEQLDPLHSVIMPARVDWAGIISYIGELPTHAMRR